MPRNDGPDALALFGHSEPDLTMLGVFDLNRKTPIHRWYPFVEGYSGALVRHLIERHQASNVFDPFGGSGTTALAAAFCGANSAFTEVNPYLRWVANTKVNCAREAYEHPDLFALRDFAHALPMLVTPRNAQHPLIEADRRRDFFPPGVAQRVVSALEWIDAHLQAPVADLARLACSTSLIPCSNMIRRTDLRRRTLRDPRPLPLIPHVRQQINTILNDVASAGEALRGKTECVGSDIRKLSLQSKYFELAITSPPYLNGTNYCRNTKLELLALDLIDDESGLAGIRDTSITAGINNVSRRRETPATIPSVEAVTEKLDRVAYDRRIPEMVRGYFSDMKLALTAVRNNVKSGGHFYLDIGDSRFSGVHVPTHLLLAAIAESVGWVLVETEPLRARRSYDGSPLTQVMLAFVAK